ncbi:acetyl-CoA carboxylase biotin carboxylase subunit [Actinomadura rugatobispora]|uniref:biotin carboxylase n=1 Tax=Actinomadura rugatobispora TaxID=1994 RepID=A0ABW0ZRE5_9ACTN|nr:acetyl-CoA carboxylase biotin carboxylase subunit [Actinomadura rugatobispora]
MFSTVLIANRGEIALRVARTCREMGIRTVAVCSTADEESAVTGFADSVVRIGPAAPRRSYLSAPAITEAALQTGAEAVHPGYGFLSEDPDFAEICEAGGLTFIGPPADVMARLGDKAAARRIMSEAGLPVLPGTDATGAAAAEAKRMADAVGYPLMIKAVAGGGGRGMTPVRGPREFVRAYRETRAAAKSLFGDGRVYLERLVEPARHIEVQVLCDRHGNGVHLGERDCSVQRRHQKLVEETPAAGVDRAMTERMCEAAVTGALACGFTGAGTFEFLVDGDDFHLMEINCRIQVEHPVTEMVTGIDLVREQIRIAAGLPLGFAQDEVRRHGAAIECRVNAEDPERGFAPAPGTLTAFRPPGGPFTRVDTDAYQGRRVPPHYDSLIAKVVTWGPDRDAAVARMDRALGEFTVGGPGVHTTTGLLRKVIGEPRFRRAEHTTALLREMHLGDSQGE